MSLSLATRRRDKTSTSTIKTKWSSQQHLSQQDYQQQRLHQPVRKQRSFIESSTKSQFTCNTGVGSSRPTLARGVSVGSQDIQRLHSRHILRKHSSISHSSNGTSAKNSKSDDLIKKNITACGQIERPPRAIQAWSSTSSILKSLDKELAHLNGVLDKSKDIRNDIQSTALDRSRNNCNNTTNNTKTDSGPSTVVSAANAKFCKSLPSSTTTAATKTTEANKVNLSIVLSHALNSSKENDYILCDQDDDDESDGLSTDSEKLKTCDSHSVSRRDLRKTETSHKTLSADQRRVLYQSNKICDQTTNANASPQSSTPVTSGLHSPRNLHISPALTIQKRPPLVRAMSAPVRIDENSKGSFLANKRKPRRRKLNTRTITCDRDQSPDHLTNVDNLKLDSKLSATNKKILQRSRSVAPDVITLVSLISSEGSDSEKEDSSYTPTNSDCNSPTRRAPSLRKSGKSVSFQENYPPTFQFASKEYSHMLRRGSIAPLAARIKSNRPPTAPPVSIFHTSNCNKISKPTTDMHESDETSVLVDENQNDEVPVATVKKPLEEESYQYPEYVRSIKERECWKLFQKMSAKGVNITYDTILRGMLTPTEFRQLQKQRELEEAKALKESEELAAISEEPAKSKKTISIDRLSENLLKN